MNTIIAQDSPNATDQLLSYFSDWRKLKVAVAWFLKWKRILLQLKQRRKDGDGSHVSLEMERAKRAVSQTLSVEDLLDAEAAVIRYSQQKRFKEEIAALSAGKSVPKDSYIYKLDPCLEDGLVRVGGRLSKAALPEETKHPLILSKDQHISTLILRHTNKWVTVEEITHCQYCERSSG